MTLTASDRLRGFVTRYHDKYPHNLPIADVGIDYAHNVAKPFMLRHEPSDRSGYLGFSQIGNTNSALLALQKLGYHNHSQELTPKQRVRFAFGYWFEYTLIEMLRYSETTQITCGETLDTCGDFKAPFMGHYDLCIDNAYLYDVKTMTSESYKKFTKEPNNYLGYLTQLSLYKHYYDKRYNTDVSAGWLCLNIDTFELSVVEYNYEQYRETLQRALEVMSRIEVCETLEDIYINCEFPKVRAEVFKKEETGNFYVPSQILNHKYAPAMFNTEVQNNGYNKPLNYFINYTTEQEFITRVQQIYTES